MCVAKKVSEILLSLRSTKGKPKPLFPLSVSHTFIPGITAVNYDRKSRRSVLLQTLFKEKEIVALAEYWPRLPSIRPSLPHFFSLEEDCQRLLLFSVLIVPGFSGSGRLSSR